MERVNDILNELRELKSPLADVPRTMPYHLPEGYFTTLITDVQAGIGMENTSDPVVDWSKANSYTVPKGYFEGIVREFWKRVEAVEPNLPLSKANPFSTPEGYFENLPQQVLAAAKAEDTKKQTRVIPLRPRVNKTIRWAAAAILMLGIGIGSYNMLQQKPSIEKQMAALPQSTVHEYVQEGIDDFDMEAIESNLVMNTNTDAASLKTERLDKEEINEYLNEMGG